MHDRQPSRRRAPGSLLPAVCSLLSCGVSRRPAPSPASKSANAGASTDVMISASCPAAGSMNVRASPSCIATVTRASSDVTKRRSTMHATASGSCSRQAWSSGIAPRPFRLSSTDQMSIWRASARHSSSPSRSRSTWCDISHAPIVTSHGTYSDGHAGVERSHRRRLIDVEVVVDRRRHRHTEELHRREHAAHHRQPRQLRRQRRLALDRRRQVRLHADRRQLAACPRRTPRRSASPRRGATARTPSRRRATSPSRARPPAGGAGRSPRRRRPPLPRRPPALQAAAASSRCARAAPCHRKPS